MGKLLAVCETDIFPEQRVFRHSRLGNILVGERPLRKLVVGLKIPCCDDNGDFGFRFRVLFFKQKFADEIDGCQTQHDRNNQWYDIFHFFLL